LNKELKQAHTIYIRHTARDKYFRVLAEVFADEQDVREILILRGLAIPYHGGTKTKDWCAEGP
jgi:micrococcal nuclease